MAKTFDPQIQKFFLEMMLTEPSCYIRVQNIYNPNNFDRSLKAAAEFLAEHSRDYGAIPTFEQINAVCKNDLNAVPGITDEHIAWFMDEFETFTKSC